MMQLGQVLDEFLLLLTQPLCNPYTICMDMRRGNPACLGCLLASEVVSLAWYWMQDKMILHQNGL